MVPSHQRLTLGDERQRSTGTSNAETPDDIEELLPEEPPMRTAWALLQYNEVNIR